jgi:hypothetical protein
MRDERSCCHRLPNAPDFVWYRTITHCSNHVRETNSGDVQSLALLCRHDAALLNVTHDEIADEKLAPKSEQHLERIERAPLGPVLAKVLGEQVGKSKPDCFKNGSGIATREAAHQDTAVIELTNGETRASIVVRGAPSDPVTRTRRSDAFEACQKNVDTHRGYRAGGKVDCQRLTPASRSRPAAHCSQ